MIADEQVAGGVHRYSRGEIQRGASRGTLVSREAPNTIARNSGDDAGGRYFANPVVSAVGDE